MSDNRRVLQIVGWKENFESGKSKDYNQCTHLYCPNKQHGIGFINLLSQKHGIIAYGVFMLLAEACSLQKKGRDGYLTDDGTPSGNPWIAKNIAFRYRMREKDVQTAIDSLSNKDVGWVQIVDIDDSSKVSRNHAGSAGYVIRDHTAPLNDGLRINKNDDEQTARDNALAAVAFGLEEKEKANPDTFTVDSLLTREGFAADDDIRDHPNATAKYVKTVIDNANARGSGKMADRKAWISSAIRRGTDKLSPKAKAARERREGVTRSAANLEKRSSESEKNAARQLDAEKAVKALSDEEVRRHADAILAEDSKYSFLTRKDVKTHPAWQLLIFDRLRPLEAK